MPQHRISQKIVKISKHQFRNPIYLARQWQLDLADGKYRSPADLSRKMGVSRSRVTQIMNLLKLPKSIIEKVSAMGDPLPKRVVTERNLRLLLKNTSRP
jgi:biotin operon repressor